MINKKVIQLDEEREKRDAFSKVREGFKEVIVLGTILRLKPCMDKITQIFIDVSENGMNIEYNFRDYFLSYNKDINNKFKKLNYEEVLDIFSEVILENQEYLRDKGIYEIRINRGYIYELVENKENV